MKISYNWLKSYVPEIPNAEKLADVFTFQLCEVESVEHSVFNNNEDWIFDLKILPDRAHDLLSHQGVAREIAGLLNVPFKDPTPMYKVPEPKPTNLQIKIESEKCRRYMGRIIRNVKVGPSPSWVKEHLESIGQRSINNIVDAANIVMYDCGQPLHAFDLDKLTSEKIVVRQAKEPARHASQGNAGGGETITTLDGKEIKLLPADMVIADGSPPAGGALAIAGVKGGKDAEVDENTKNILIEVANFDPASVRKTARRVNIFTDAVKRFENDLSPELCDFAMKEITGLLVEVACPERPEGVEWEEVVDIYPNKQQERKISFDAKFINQKLGSDISSDEMENILKSYVYAYTRKGDSFEIVVPALRLDLVNDFDMVEEIGRVYGYDKVKPIIPQINLPAGEAGFQPKQNETFLKIVAARKKLLIDGYSEVMTYTFRDNGEVAVLQSASDKKFLRTNLSDGLKESFELNKKNMPLLGLEDLKIFEIGTVFSNKGEQINVAYSDKKNIIEVSLDEFCKDISLDLSLEPGNYNLETNFKMWSLFPFISRDIAVWMPEGELPEVLIKLIKDNGTELMVNEPKLFDKFSKENRTSYGFRMVFQSMDRTLTDEEVNKIMDKISSEIANKDWQVR